MRNRSGLRREIAVATLCVATALLPITPPCAGQSAIEGLKELSLWGGSYLKGDYLEYSLYKTGEALDQARANGDERETMALLNEIGIDYIARRRYDLANASFTGAAAIAKRLNDEPAAVSIKTNLARLYHETGDLGEAMALYSEILTKREKAGQMLRAAECRYDIARVYRAWGQYDEAMKRFSALMPVADTINEESLIFKVRDAMVETCVLQGNVPRARELSGDLITLVEQRQWRNRLAQAYSRDAGILTLLGKDEEAIAMLRKALKISAKYGDGGDSAELIQQLSRACRGLGRYQEAIDYAEMALLAAKETGQLPEQADMLTDIGRNYASLQKYPEAIKNLNDAIAIKEKLRLTATGAIRRDYLASQIETYEFLTDAYLAGGNAAEAFNAKEASSAKYMAEQIAEKSGNVEAKFSGIEAHRKSLDPKTLVVCYDVSGTGLITLLIADSKGVSGQRVDATPSLAAITDTLLDADASEAKSAGMRGIAIVPAASLAQPRSAGDPRRQPTLDGIVGNYRRLLVKPDSFSRGITVAAATGKAEGGKGDFLAISRGLYDLLIAPLGPALKGKDRLIIIPDGSLSLIPFETLIAPDGTFLIEKYDVSYTQSLGINERIASRAANGRGPAKEVLSFGGAMYDGRVKANESDATNGSVITDKQAYALLDRGAAASAYGKLGYTWANLPGTLTEATEIRNIMKGGDIKTGKDVEEAAIKALSADGTLRQYRVIHFATHGLSVPEVPELSALVLSQFDKPINGEDGYLTMGEILSLDIAADFVNLSACETGLGKIYRGEGVVGLTQSFIVAGANGVSVSLWSVADESTKDFMLGLYRLAKEKGFSWPKAIAQMKREFIKGGTYSAPYYWAPFVYYGNAAKK